MVNTFFELNCTDATRVCRYPGDPLIPVTNNMKTGEEIVIVRTAILTSIAFSENPKVYAATKSKTRHQDVIKKRIRREWYNLSIMTHNTGTTIVPRSFKKSYECYKIQRF